MLGQAALSGAVTLLPAGVAVAGRRRRTVSQRWIGSLRGEAAAVRAPGGAVLVGVQWKGPARARIDLRALAAHGDWGPWVPASTQGHDAHGGPPAERFGEPLWIGHAGAVQLRSERPVAGVLLHFVAGSGPPVARAAAARQLAQPVLNAGPGQPPIIARRAWAQGHAPPSHLAGYGTVRLAFVHHTVNANVYSAGDVPALLRAIFDYHTQVRGFFDIAYNFLIDAYGRIWEGRAGGIDMAVIGAHAGGYNTESTGVAVIGDFDSVVPSPQALTGLKSLLAWKLSLHGLPTLGKATVVVNPDDASYTPFSPGAQVSLPRIAGHRDGDLTACPGDALYGRLPAIRRKVAVLAGTPAQVTFEAPKAAIAAGQPAVLSGRLTQLGGTPLAAAAIELQRLNWDFAAPSSTTDTIATVQSAQDGTWGTSITLYRNTLLRVLHRPAPATVADWSEILIAPAIALTVTSTSPLTVSGSVSPAKSHVIVDLYRAAQPHKPIAKRKVSGSAGTFSATLGTPAPDDYVLIARTVAGLSNAAGASPPVAVTIT
jgi:hypothetical protein